MRIFHYKRYLRPIDPESNTSQEGVFSRSVKPAKARIAIVPKISQGGILTTSSTPVTGTWTVETTTAASWSTESTTAASWSTESTTAVTWIVE